MQKTGLSRITDIIICSLKTSKTSLKGAQCKTNKPDQMSNPIEVSIGTHRLCEMKHQTSHKRSTRWF